MEGGEKEEGKKRESNERWERVCKEKTKTLSKSWSCFRKRLVVVVVGWVGAAGLGGSGGCHRGVPDGQAVSSQGVIVGGGGGEEGWRTTWGCQGAWQVETRRPVTGGEHGSVREDGGEGPR